MRPELTCQSRITQVVVYARGAVVTRRVAVPAELPDGPCTMRIPGITPFAEPGSVRATLSPGPRQVVSVKSQLVLPSPEATAGPSETRLQEIDDQLRALHRERTALETQAEQIGRLRLDPLRAAANAPADRAQMDHALAAQALLVACAAAIDTRRVALSAQSRQLEHQRKAASLVSAQTRLQERLAQTLPSRTVIVDIDGSGAPDTFAIHYMVAAARWWPVYTLRMSEDGRSAQWLREALVTQSSGEDWTQVSLSVSSADRLHDARLPELPSLRLGRTQPRRRGYRPPPPGLDALFEPYHQALVSPQPAMLGGGSRGDPPLIPELADADDEDALFAQEAAADLGEAGPRKEAAPALMQSGAPVHDLMFASFAAPPAPQAAPPPIARAAAAVHFAPADSPPPPSRGRHVDPSAAGGAGDFAKAKKKPASAVLAAEPSPPAEDWLDFDRLQLAPPEDASHRGRLRPSASPHQRAVDEQMQAAQATIEALAPRGGLSDPMHSRGQFDHRDDAPGPVDLAADAVAQRVALGSAHGPVALRLCTVPSLAPEVYREAELTNPFAAPLLAGPVDVYVDGALLLTAALPSIGRQGTLRIGLGLDERIAVARNLRADESSAGLLGNATAIAHTVAITLRSAYRQPVTVDVMERVPVSDDKDIDITVLHSRPQASPYDQTERDAPLRHGLRWQVTVPEAGEAHVELRYRITLPAKQELIGGNRRE